MATFRKRKRDDGVSCLVHVRVRPFKPTAKTFRQEKGETWGQLVERARAWAEPLERELRAQSRGGTRSDVTQLTIGALVREYLKDPSTQALRTHREVERLLNGFWVNKYGAQRVLDFGVIQLRDARDRLNVGARRAGTVNRHLSVLRSAWNWGRSAGLLPLERAWPSRLMLPEPQGRKRFLSDAELTSLLKAAEVDAVMRAAIIVSLATGVRQGELLALTWGDVDIAQATARIRRTTTRDDSTKNDETRSVYLNPSSIAALQVLRKSKIVSIDSHIFLTKSGGPLKQSFLERKWGRIRTAAKLVDFKWHDLRHTFASEHLQQGATLAQIGQALGHRSPSMTARYSHLVAGAPVVGHDALDRKLRGG